MIPREATNRAFYRALLDIILVCAALGVGSGLAILLARGIGWAFF